MNYSHHHLQTKPLLPPYYAYWSSTHEQKQNIPSRHPYHSNETGGYITNIPYNRNQTSNNNVHFNTMYSNNPIKTAPIHTTAKADSETLNAALALTGLAYISTQPLKELREHTYYQSNNSSLSPLSTETMPMPNFPLPPLVNPPLVTPRGSFDFGSKRPCFETFHAAEVLMKTSKVKFEETSMPDLPLPPPLTLNLPSVIHQGSFDTRSTTTTSTTASTLTSSPIIFSNETKTETAASRPDCSSSSKPPSLSSSSSSVCSFTGSISLSLPDDQDMLSPLHCFMRKYCIEAFTVSGKDEQSTTSKPNHNKSRKKPNKKIKLDVVGIRCVFCKNLPYYERADRSITYPSSVNNIYYSMETWQRRHAIHCKSIPQWTRREMVKLSKSSRGIGGGRRRYWADSAVMSGMVDTHDGIRFTKSPELCTYIDETTKTVTTHDSSIKTDEERPVHTSTLNKKSITLVDKSDNSIITDFLYVLVSQMEGCHFTEDDRSGGRSKVKTNKNGFPGLQCKHCCGKAGYGRYFPASISCLNLANSDRNMYNHLMKCRRCPSQIKDELMRLCISKREGGQKMERGGRKVFFKRVWERLHASTKVDHKQSSTPKRKRKRSNDTSSMANEGEYRRINLSNAKEEEAEQQCHTNFVEL